MKKALAVLMLLSFSLSSAFATINDHHHRSHRMDKKRTVLVKGKKARDIYEALSQTEITTRDTHKYTLDIKKVGALGCVKMTNKADTSKVEYRCGLKGKTLRFRHDHRRERRDRHHDHCHHHHRGHNHDHDRD